MGNIDSLYTQGVFLFSVLLLSQATLAGGGYAPMPGSYRPSHAASAGSNFRNNAPGQVPAPASQQAWSAAQSYPAQGYANGYQSPVPYSPPVAYPRNDSFNRSFNINPTRFMDELFDFGSRREYDSLPFDNWTGGYYPVYPYAEYAQQPYAPAIQQPYAPAAQQAAPPPASHTRAATPQRPLSPQVGKQPSPYIQRSTTASDSRFRPPELVGTP